jgi:hypothetical protein
MTMTNKLLLAATAVSLVACVKQDQAPEELRRAIPTSEQVEIKLPANNERAIGQLAEWYQVTRGTTLMFNGGTAWVLVLVHLVVQQPPTSVDGDTYTCGPFGGDGLDPASYRLDVTDNLDGTYTWAISGKGRVGGSGEFEPIISGNADSTPGENRGNGDFLIDFDAGKRVNPIDSDPDARGTILVRYDLAARHLDMDIETTDDAGRPLDARYEYDEQADRAGRMFFAVRTDMGQGAALEEAQVESRWNADGSGRADVEAFDGDIQVRVTAGAQCWDKGFISVYEEFTGEGPDAAFNANAGNAADCKL